MSVLYSLTGNICSGKSTLGRALSQKHSIPFYSIDDYRVKFNAFDIPGEEMAWKELMFDISKKETALLESSGLSENLPGVYAFFDKTVVVLLTSPVDILIHRACLRTKKIPFCYSFKNKPLGSHIIEIDIKLKLLKYNFQLNSGQLTISELVKIAETEILQNNTFQSSCFEVTCSGNKAGSPEMLP
jgi:hypothetical protein